MGCKVCGAEDTALTVCSRCGKDICIKRCAAWYYYYDEDKTLKWKRICVKCKTI